MELSQYIDCRPKKVQKKALEQKITNHKKDLLRKDLGNKKIKRTQKQLDDMSIISSERSCFSTSSNAAKALKMRIPQTNPIHDEAIKNRLDLTQILHFSPAEPIVFPTTQPSGAGPSAPEITPIIRRNEPYKLAMFLTLTHPLCQEITDN